MKKIIISVVLAALVAAAVFGTFAIQNNNGEAQQTTDTEPADKAAAPVSSTQPPAVSVAPVAQRQQTPPTTTTTTPFSNNKNGYTQPMDLYCLRLIFPEEEENSPILKDDYWAINTGNTSFSLAGAAAEYLNPGEQIELVTAKGDTGCVIAKMILTDTLPDAAPISQSIDNHCYQTTKRLNTNPAYKTKTAEPNGVSIESEVSLTAAIPEMDRDGESLVFTDSHWNIGCAYIKNGKPKQFSEINAKTQPTERYCFETFREAMRTRARTITIVENLKTDIDFYTLLGEAIANWEVGVSVTLGAGQNGQSGCIIRKSLIADEPAKEVSDEPSETATTTTTTVPPASNVPEPVEPVTTVSPTTEDAPKESHTG